MSQEQNTIQRWASWAAVSSQPQASADKISISEQLGQNRTHADEHGGTIVVELVIPGESRSIDTWEEACARIDAYAQLGQLLVNHSIDVLTFYDATRLGRTHSLIATVRQLCASAHVSLYETTNPPNEIQFKWRYDDALIGAIKSVGSQQEVARLVERRRIGMLGRNRRGEFATNLNFGYIYHYTPTGERSVIINEVAANTLRLIFRLYLDGQGAKAIAVHLDELGHPSPNDKPWHHSAITRFIHNSWIYAGFVHINVKSSTGATPERAPGKQPPIITCAMADALDHERTSREHNHNITASPRLLTGVCYCAECGGSMHYADDIRVKNLPTLRLRCTRHKPNVYIRHQTVVNALTEYLASLSTGHITPTAQRDPLTRLTKELATATAQLTAIATKFERADSAFVTGKLNQERYDAQLQRIGHKQSSLVILRDGLQTQIDALVQRGTQEARIVEARNFGLEMITTAPTPTANIWLRSHFRIYCASGNSVVIVLL